MTVKSNFKLDKRINSMDDVQTCLQYDESYIGERGYFASDLCDLSNLSNCLHDTLAQIILDGAGDDIFRTPHDVDYVNWGSRFFVPERLLKPVEKKYRPYTMKEFLREYSIGESIFKIRDKRDPEHIYQFLYIGHSNSLVYLGGWALSLQDLFNYYESGDGIGDEETWQPFGVLEE